MAQHENVPERKANRLIGETSPYLLQHAYNPVDWYPWGPEALEQARRENKPILLSIGYAACHWCHVMERESFEDPSIAALMNDKFVCIKVDREERPDLDSIYMDAVQAMTGRGGWPMTMFLTPEGKPFYGGTYFPPDNRHGLPSFRMILEAVHDAWINRRGEIASQTAALVEQISAQTPPASTEPLTSSLLTSAAQSIAGSFDFQLGGTAGAPKFPQAPVLEFLLRGAGSSIGRSAEMVEVTLRRMALGGIYDQVGGGFARYSVDAEWLVPHFEKMLYDNAQLARVYTRAWQLTKSPFYERIAIETLEYLLRDMRDPAGGFYASEDADSEGEEGKFYVWSYEEFMRIAPEAADYYGVTPQGNFEGMNILTASNDGAPPEARGRLLAARTTRVRPARDDKILASWNALAVSAFAEAGAAFGRDDFVEAASAAATFAITRIARPDGRLLHSFKDDQARVLGMLEDYSYLAEALFTLWEVTLQPGWFEECNRICAAMIALFWDTERGGFYSTGNDHEQLIARPKEIIDGATPSPNAVASLVLQKLAVVLDDPTLAGRSVEILRLGHAFMARAPQAAGTLLCSLDFYLSAPREIVILGEREAALPLIKQIWSRFLPNKVVAGPGIDSPMLKAKTPIHGKATAFVCEHYACQSPTTDPKDLAAQLS